MPSTVLFTGADQFVAVGGPGTILTSADGIDWVQRDLGTTNNLSAVGYANGRFVAVGSAYTSPSFKPSKLVRALVAVLCVPGKLQVILNNPALLWLLGH